MHLIDLLLMVTKKHDCMQMARAVADAIPFRGEVRNCSKVLLSLGY